MRRANLLLSNFDQYQPTDITEVLSYQNPDHRLSCFSPEVQKWKLSKREQFPKNSQEGTKYNSFMSTGILRAITGQGTAGKSQSA